ncbi:hypothetical protein LL946_01755 [Knoellia locipacati]|uniref:hypothetical protein n=1 Tax=Knoellia locipacati TaxID=882824 RepID=UPI00384B3978
MGDSVNPDKPRWYYVGNGTFRFWDGLVWTDEYRAGVDPRHADAQNYSGPKHRSLERGGLLLWLLGLGVVLVTATVAAVVTSVL